MIYLTEKKLLFVKPRKTAGTSVHIALSCNASGLDIVTPISLAEEAVRWKMGGQFPVNWAQSPSDEEICRARFDRFLSDGVVPKRYFGLRPGRLYKKRRARFFPHITPAQIAARTDARFLNDVTLVTMCRHPYEQIISLAFHIRAGRERPLAHFVEKALRKPAYNEDYLFGPKTPDVIIRYEHLHEDLASMERRFGLNLVEKLPFTKHKTRTDRRSAKDILTEDQRERCYQLYFRTFVSLGYCR